jgi:cytoskeleton protein RodZ
MTDTDSGEEATLFPKTAGERLREAREAQGLSLAEIAARTRIPVRQLEAVETSNFAALPSITYSVGFAKAYARAVGVDEVAIARDVRGQNDQTTRRTEYEAYEVTDNAHVPTGGIALIASVLGVLLLIAVGLWYGTNLFRGEESQPAPVAEATENVQEAPPEAAPTPVGSGQVTLTATDEVWVRIYDAAGKTLYENTLKPGDRYDVPADANNPMINVGRPDKLQVLLNGSAVAPLGDGAVAIKDVAISAAALTARANGTPQPAPSATATPGGAVPAAAATSAPRTTQPRPRRTPSAAATSAPGLPVVTPPAASTPVPSATPAP